MSSHRMGKALPMGEPLCQCAVMSCPPHLPWPWMGAHVRMTAVPAPLEHTYTEPYRQCAYACFSTLSSELLMERAGYSTDERGVRLL